MRKFILLLTISWCSVLAYASTCTRYTFENDFDDLFSTPPDCRRNTLTHYPWRIGSFEDFKPSSPFHERSTKFVYALSLPEVSCASSFTFPMNAGGIVEVNIYLENPTLEDLIQVIAFNDLQWVGSDQRNGANPGGWYTLRFTVSGSEQFMGHLVFIGVSSLNSTVLVDSFRYIPPGMPESDCELYELIETTTESATENTSESTTEIFTESTTESPTQSTTENTERPPESPPECSPKKTIGIDINMSITINIV